MPHPEELILKCPKCGQKGYKADDGCKTCNWNWEDDYEKEREAFEMEGYGDPEAS